MSKHELHKIRVEFPDGRAVLGRVTLDGEELRGVSAVSFGMDMEHDPIVTLRLYADLVIDGEAQIVRNWRQGLPWWRRLPYWLQVAGG